MGHWNARIYNLAAVSESASNPDHQFDSIADELYALPPDGFAAARDEQVRKARAEGRQALARELGRLRRPTQSAWLINLLWRDQREVLEQLLQLAEELSRAQAEASGPELQRLTAVRRHLEAALIRGARALAQKAGVTVSASTEREAQETLAAALALPEVANEVRTGRLVKPASYAGFGALLPATPTASTPPHTSEDTRAPIRLVPPAAPETDEIAQRAARRARERREEAERRVQEARAALELAASALAESTRVAEAAREHRQAVAKQVEQLEERLKELQDQLREVQKEFPAAQQAELVAATRQDQADKAHEAALRTLGEAEKHLMELAHETI
jgi:hypothetical protein